MTDDLLFMSHLLSFIPWGYEATYLRSITFGALKPSSDLLQ